MKKPPYAIFRGASTGCLWISMLLFVACNESPVNDAGPDDSSTQVSCDSDSECEGEELCIGNICQIGDQTVVSDGGSNTASADSGVIQQTDAGPEDAGPPPVGILTAQPAEVIEFGGQRLGVPVNRSVQLINVGNAPLTVVQVVLDDNETEEFSAEPVGSINMLLDPQDSISIDLIHLPIDGQPDQATLKVVHSADSDAFFEVDLIAEFKGDAEAHIGTTTADLTSSLTTFDFGIVPLTESAETQFFVVNDGASDSVLSVTEFTLTPENAGFAFAHEGTLPTLLSSYAGHCPTGLSDCPMGTAACVEEICVDGDGHPVDATSIVATFTPPDVGMHTATLTLEYEGNQDQNQTDLVFTGEGATGELQLSPGAVDFQEIFVGETREETITMTNAGGADALITDIQFGAETPFSFSLASALPITLGPGEEQSIVVQYTPSEEGEWADQLSVILDSEETLSVDVA